MTNPEIQIRRRSYIAWIFTLAFVIASFALVGRAVWMMDRGFDFTDQAFYLASMQRPSEYDFTYGFWPYALEPLYKLTSGSVATIQRLGACCLAVLGGVAGLVATQKLHIDRNTPARFQFVATAMYLPLGHYVWWIVTPGYNWLALFAALCLLISMLFLFDEERFIKSAIFAAAAAVCIVFARPQGVISFGAIYLTAVLLAYTKGKERAQQIAWAGGLSALVVLLLMTVLPIETIVSQAKEYVAFFGTAHPIQYSLVDQQWTYLRSVPLFLVSAVLLLLLLCSTQRRIWLDMSALFISLIILLVLVGKCLRYHDEPVAGESVAAVALASLSIAYIYNRDRRSLIAVLAVASLIPWAATSGSSNGVLTQLAFFVGLSNAIALAALMMVSRSQSWVSPAACCVSMYLTFGFVQHGMNSPYRLAAPLNLQLLPTRLGWGSELKLDTKTNEFVESVLAVAATGGFCRGDPAIDLSGALPGVVFAMGGRMPVFPWIFSGYPFSDHFLEQYLRKMGSGMLYRSWLILNEDTGTFSRQQIESYGVDFTRFRMAVELHHPVNGSSVKIYAPLVANGAVGCARQS